MLFVNICACVSYCRNAGNPYLSPKHRKYVRKFKFIIVVWNFAFITKSLLSYEGITILDIDVEKQTEDNFWYSVETFANIMFTEIIPFYFVIDANLVKILTF